MTTPKSKRTIKNDPFADLIPVPVEASEQTTTMARVKPVAKSARTQAEAKTVARPLKKAKITLMVDGDLVERIKNAVYWNPSLTVSGLAIVGIRKAIEEVETQNQGPYPQRSSELRAGRPLK